MDRYFRWGIYVNLILSLIIYGLLFYFDRQVIGIFNQDPMLIEMASEALPIFSLSFVPMALNLIYTAFLFSTKRTTQANAIAICRGIVVKAIGIFCIPMLLGKGGIWIAPFAAELFTLLLSIQLKKKTKLVYR